MKFSVLEKMEMLGMKVFIKYLIGTFETVIYCKMRFDKYFKNNQIKKIIKTIIVHINVYIIKST